ncbi:MAG: hypothetical protein QOF93_494, partial [Verrucomicrobiota bacterium]
MARLSDARNGGFEAPIAAIPTKKRFDLGDVLVENGSGVFAFLGSYLPRIGTDIAFLVFQTRDSAHAKKIEDAIKNRKRIGAEIFVFKNANL